MRTLGVPLVLLLGCAGCTRGPEAPAPPAQAVKAPDLGLIELCPPKPPPPGTISREEMKRRDQARMEGRQRDYERQLAEVKEKRAEAERVAASRCQPILEAIRAGRPVDDTAAPPAPRGAPPDPSATDQPARRLGAPIDQLVTCRAFAAKSDEPCAASRASELACRFRRAVFARGPARDAAASASVAELAFAMCQRDVPKGPCAALRDAVAKGRPAACPKAAPIGPLCSVLAGPPAAQPEGWLALLAAQRFAGVWPDAPVADRALTDAATAKADACAPLEAALREGCVKIAAPPVPEEPRRPEDVPGSAPSVPKVEGRTTESGTGMPGAPAPTPPTSPAPLPAK